MSEIKNKPLTGQNTANYTLDVNARIPEPTVGKQIDRVVAQMPGWKCYCCHDGGFVIEDYKIIPGHQPHDPAVACVRCNAFLNLYGNSDPVINGVYYATKEQCDALHRFHYEGWLKTVENWGKQRQQMPNLAAIGRPMPKARNAPTLREVMQQPVEMEFTQPAEEKELMPF